MRKEEIHEIIKQAVNAGIRAGKANAFKNQSEIYKTVERRLYAYPTILKKIDEDENNLEDMQKFGPAEKSKSIVRFSKTGIRLEPDEVFEALIQDAHAKLAANQHEASEIYAAISAIETDSYYLAVDCKYFQGLSDDKAAELLSCDPSTLRRNRSRLVRKIAVELYGSMAL